MRGRGLDSMFHPAGALLLLPSRFVLATHTEIEMADVQRILQLFTRFEFDIRFAIAIGGGAAFTLARSSEACTSRRR